MPLVPCESVIHWVATAFGARAKAKIRKSLHGAVSPWLMEVEHQGKTFEVILRITVPDRIDRAGILTNVAALTLAEKHDLLTPRVIACDQTGEEAGMVASVETYLPGVSEFPANLDAAQLERTGAEMAKVHSIQIDPQPFLSLRTRPIQPDDYARDRRWAAFFQASHEYAESMANAYCSLPTQEVGVTEERLSRVSTTPLLQLADEYVRIHGMPQEENVFLHGDLWPGNSRWLNNEFAAFIDWKTAGVGNPGVDLGSMRMQVALRYGMHAAGYVREGWEGQTGRQATNIDYWDAVAALNTPTVMEGVARMRSINPSNGLPVSHQSSE